MSHNNPHQRVASLRPKSEQQLKHEAIARDCVAAWNALKAGEHHPRHETMMERRKRKQAAVCAREAAFYPPLPRIIVTAPPVQRDAFHDYLDRRHGAGGAERQE